MTVALIVLGAGAAPAAADGHESEDVMASGHIAVGSPTTATFVSPAVATDCEVEGTFAFCFEDPIQGATIRTVTVTKSPVHDVDVYFHNETEGFLGGCATAGEETGCEVPANADSGSVDGWIGVDMWVYLVVESYPEG